MIKFLLSVANYASKNTINTQKSKRTLTSSKGRQITIVICYANSLFACDHQKVIPLALERSFSYTASFLV